MVIRQRPAARVAVPDTPRLLDERLLGIASMAVITMDDPGRVVHWNTAAGDLFGFGTAPGSVAGRPLRTLLRLPQEHRSAFEFGGPHVRHVWTGVCIVPRVGDGRLCEVAWWVYPLAGHDTVRGVAIATDAHRLREEGPGLALGDMLIVAPPGRPLTSASGTRVLRVEPTLVRSPSGDAALFGRRLVEMLPPDADAERIVPQVLDRGYPAVNVSLTVRLPFAARRETPPRVKRVRTEAHPPDQPLPPDPLHQAAAQERLDFLNDAGMRIVATLDPAETAAVLCDTLVPRFADFADVQLLESITSEQELPPVRAGESPTTERVAVRYDEEQDRWGHLVPVGKSLRVPAGGAFTSELTAGRSVHIPRVGERRSRQICAAFGDRDLGPLIAGRAMLVTPLIARGQLLGTMVLLRRRDRPPFGETDVTMIEELSRRAAVCVDNGRLYRREARVAAELQHSMLPAAPPDVAGAQVCYRYVPANEAVRVGGDWFDAIPLPGSRLALVVGDVMGHGLTSAAIMGQMRTAVRTLAAQDPPPDHLLRQLDDLARRLGDDCLATCLYAVYDPVARRCEVASAGHLPPVLVSPDGEALLLAVPPGAPIGVGGVAFETVAFDVEDGSQFIVCTDGLVERRGEAIDVGLTALRQMLTGPQRPLENLCDLLVDGLRTAGRRDDDIALLAVRCTGIPGEDVFSWTLEADPTIVRHTRRLARQALGTWGLDALVPTVELLVSELVTNAVLHGAGDIGLRLIRANSLLCEVRDDGHDLPHLRRAEATDENGRGLQLVSALAERWGTQRTSTGKVVWFEHPL